MLYKIEYSSYDASDLIETVITNVDFVLTNLQGKDKLSENECNWCETDDGATACFNITNDKLENFESVIINVIESEGLGAEISKENRNGEFELFFEF